jgi:hypothetical protein
MAPSFEAERFYEQTINEIRICSKIGYNSNICTMLGYVSNDELTCLLLELAETNLPNVLETMKEEISQNRLDIVNVIRYLQNIAIQICDGMVCILSV